MVCWHDDGWSVGTDNEWLSDDDSEYIEDNEWMTYLTECDWLWLYGLDDVLDTFYIN